MGNDGLFKNISNKNATAKGGVGWFGAAGGDRTHDPWLRRPILYPLSYSRNAELIVVMRQTADVFGTG